MFFFLYCDGDHRDLHSFPTRRSSDLIRFLCTSKNLSKLREPTSSSPSTSTFTFTGKVLRVNRSEEHTSELQSRQYLVCRLLLEKKKRDHRKHRTTRSRRADKQHLKGR